MATINDLPEEILEYILCLISPYNDLRSCRQVCQRWYLCCHGVVEKRKSRFYSALKMGCVKWFSPVYPSHVIPISKRYSHCSCVFESSMYVFGGCTSTNTTFNDLWRFDLGSHEWTRPLTTGTYPSPKAYASMVTWDKSLVLFGGWTHPSVYPLHQQWVLFSELHVYDILGNRWTQLYSPGSPPPTAGHSASVHGSVMVVFGGMQKLERTFASTGDVFCLDLVQQCWFKPLLGEEGPNPRYGHSHIKLDDRHILVLSGCGGSNKLYNDVWLLTMPEDLHDRSARWVWQEVQVRESEHMPPQMWYNPACKVGNSVVVLSNLGGPGGGVQSGSMSQLLLPGSVRRQAANVWVPPVAQAEVRVPAPPPPPPQRPEVNLNGHRGFLRMAEPSESSSDESEEGSASLGVVGVGRARARPSIRPNASSDRERRLQVLSRMKERLRELSRQQQDPGGGGGGGGGAGTSKPQPQPPPRNTVVPHLLDISGVISRREARWWPVNQAKNQAGNQTNPQNQAEAPHPPSIGTPPHPSLFYSLVLGRDRLVMFGGIPPDPTGDLNQENASNSVIFLSAPSSSYFCF